MYIVRSQTFEVWQSICYYLFSNLMSHLSFYQPVAQMHSRALCISKWMFSSAFLSPPVTSVWKSKIQFLCLCFYAVDNTFHSCRDTPTHLAQEPFMLIVSVPAKALKTQTPRPHLPHNTDCKCSEILITEYLSSSFVHATSFFLSWVDY